MPNALRATAFPVPPAAPPISLFLLVLPAAGSGTPAQLSGSSDKRTRYVEHAMNEHATKQRRM